MTTVYRQTLDAYELACLRAENARLRTELVAVRGDGLIPFNDACLVCDAVVCSSRTWRAARSPRWWRKGRPGHFARKCWQCGCRWREAPRQLPGGAS